MKSPPSSKAPALNQPHEMLSRLYREIGISAVAAALETAGYLVPAPTIPVANADRVQADRTPRKAA